MEITAMFPAPVRLLLSMSGREADEVEDGVPIFHVPYESSEDTMIEIAPGLAVPAEIVKVYLCGGCMAIHVKIEVDDADYEEAQRCLHVRQRRQIARQLPQLIETMRNPPEELKGRVWSRES